MELMLIGVLAAALAAAAWFTRGLVAERAQVMKWEQGLFFASGRFERVLGPSRD